MSNDYSHSGPRPTVKSVSIINNQLVISGDDLDNSKSVKITGPNSFDETFQIESKTPAKLVANSVKNISYAVGSIFSLIISDAQGASTFSVTFTLSNGAVVSSSILDGAVTLSKLEPLTASADGQVLYWNDSATQWQTKSISGLTHKGSFDASINNDQTSGLFDGRFYVCTSGGSFDPDSGSASGITWSVGDWAVYDSQTGWSKIAATNSVTNVAGKTGAVTLTWSDIAKTNSKLKDIVNVDMTTTPPTDGQYLVWDNTNSKWIPGDVTISSGNISTNAVVSSSINAGA